MGAKMNEEERRILKRFSPLFPREGLKFGLECDRGWYKIIKETLQKLEDFVKNAQITDFEIVQIKEKVGVLKIRYNCSSCDDSERRTIDSIITEATRKSSSTCELCGATTPDVKIRVIDKVVVKTVCDKCMKEFI